MPRPWIFPFEEDERNVRFEDLIDWMLLEDGDVAKMHRWRSRAEYETVIIEHPSRDEQLRVFVPKGEGGKQKAEGIEAGVFYGTNKFASVKHVWRDMDLLAANVLVYAFTSDTLEGND